MRDDKMKVKNINIMIFLFASIIVILSTQAYAEPSIDITPEQPTPEGTLEVTVNTNDETVEEVYFEYFECQENGVCSIKKNESLTKISPNTFSKSITLQLEDAVYLQYTIITKDDQGWNEYFKLTKVEYDTSSSTNNNQTTDNGTPGFEFLILVFSIMVISLIAYRRKR